MDVRPFPRDCPHQVLEDIMNGDDPIQATILYHHRHELMVVLEILQHLCARIVLGTMMGSDNSSSISNSSFLFSLSKKCAHRDDAAKSSIFFRQASTLLCFVAIKSSIISSLLLLISTHSTSVGASSVKRPLV